MGARMRVAIIMPTRKRGEGHSARCIPIVERTTAHLDVDLQVVESAGTDFRFSRSINRGFAASPDADAWVLLNDDAFMDDGWLDAMIATAQDHPEAGVIGAVLRYPEGDPRGRIQFAGGEIPLSPMEFMRRGAELRAPLWALRKVASRGFRSFPYMFNHYRSVDPRHRLDFITGACCMVTRACLEKVGTYDERYQLGAEDVDHSLRALEGGFELAMATQATGIHLDGGSGGHYSPKQMDSLRTFEETWSAARIRAATRKGGRRGVYHP